MPVPPTTLPTIDQRNADQLLTLLKKRESLPNVLTLDEFRRYAPLYLEANKTAEALEKTPSLADLAQEYQTRIDFYKPTHIIRSKADPTVVLRLPQIFVPLRSLSHTAENEKAVSANYTYRRSDLPKVWSRAQNLMTNALFQEQNTPTQISKIATVRAETQDIMAEINRVYGRPVTGPVAETTTSTSTALSADLFEDM